MDSVNYTPPVRRSMSDEQLAIVLSQPHADETSMLAAMHLLEQQSALRAEDVRLEAMWELEMQVLNTPQSLAALNAFRTGTAPSVESAPVSPVTQPVANFTPLEPIAQPVEPAFTSVFSTSVDAPSSLFDQIARAAEPAVLETETQVAQSTAGAVGPVSDSSGEKESQQFPLVQVSSAPDISVEASAPKFALTGEAIVFETPAPAPTATVDSQNSFAQANVEQQITEFEESRELGFDGAAIVAAEVTDTGVVDVFGELIEPEPAATYLDDARAVISTAHGPQTNQRASALFFNWLPIGGSVLPVVLAVYVHSLGLALTDSVVAVLTAIFAAFATTTSGAIAGKRAGLPTFIVSRATFGVYGARVPAALFAIFKLATASVIVLLLVIASKGAVDHWLVEGPNATRWQVGPISVALWQIIIGLAVLLVSIASFIRLRYIKFLNFVVGIIAGSAVLGALSYHLWQHGVTASFYYLQSWPATIGAATVVFAALGTVWSSSGADFASSLQRTVKGSSVIAWSSLSLFILPSLIATATLMLLQTSDASDQLLGFASIVPSSLKPYAYGIICAVAILLAAIELRSTRLAVRGVYGRWGGAITQTILALVFVAISLAGWHFYSTQGLLYNLRDYAIVLSVPVAAWLGIFAADTLLRRIAYHEISLTRSYGFYKNFNVLNLIGWAFASAAGLGMISSNLTEFAWTGYLAKFAVNPDFWASSNLGVGVAFALGLLVPMCFGIPRIKRQEAEVLSIESRRYELRDVLVTSEIQQVDAFSVEQ